MKTLQIGNTYLDSFGKQVTILGHAVDHKPKFPLFYSAGNHYNEKGEAIRGGFHLILPQSKNDEMTKINKILSNIHSNNPVDKLALIKDGLKALQDRLNTLLE
jgi:hypothetical protein